MSTVSDYVARNTNRAEEMVAEAYRVVEVNDVTTVEDALSDLMHLLESIHGATVNGASMNAVEVRREVLSSVERAAGHWASESSYAQRNGDEDSDVLGGIPILAVNIIGPYTTDF